MTSPQNYNCIFCKETFSNKELLQIHFRKHADPGFNQNKLKKSPSDVSSTSEKTNDAVEMVSCDACSEEFPSISKAITHKHKVHPDLDAKYFCPWCGKLFTLKYLYNKHIQTNHEEKMTLADICIRDFHCDCCDVDFYSPSAMLHHNKFFHRQETELAAIGQSKKQKMFHEELLLVYYCTFCGEEYNNKVNLHKHMSDDHGDENQSPNEILRCPLCDAIFYHLDAYELHLTFHGSDDLYVEKNDVHESIISEFTLETVPPIMETIEDIDHQNLGADNMGQHSIEDFLQMAMVEDGDADKSERKSKKHKKHKKSKKAAITLDEFLNMNSDVFGEGLDFQGIEEVPTQVVAKHLKGKKNQVEKSAKKITASEIEKLKSLGVVVKKKPGQKPVVNPGSKVNINKNVKVKNIANDSGEQVQGITNNTILSRFINQTNSQLKITKTAPKCNEKNTDLDTKEDNENENIAFTEKVPCEVDKVVDKIDIEPKSSQDECLKEDEIISNKFVISPQADDINPIKTSSAQNLTNDTLQLQESTSVPQIQTNLQCLDSNLTEKSDKIDDVATNHENTSCLGKSQNDHFKSLKHLGNLTVKSINNGISCNNQMAQGSNELGQINKSELKSSIPSADSHRSNTTGDTVVGQNSESKITEFTQLNIPDTNKTACPLRETCNQVNQPKGTSSDVDDTNDSLVDKQKDLTKPLNVLKQLGNITIKSINKTEIQGSISEDELDETYKEPSSKTLGNKIFHNERETINHFEDSNDIKKVPEQKILENFEDTSGYQEFNRKQFVSNNTSDKKIPLDILKKLGNISVKSTKDNKQIKNIQTSEKDLDYFDRDDDCSINRLQKPIPAQNTLKSSNKEIHVRNPQGSESRIHQEKSPMSDEDYDDDNKYRTETVAQFQSNNEMIRTPKTSVENIFKDENQSVVPVSNTPTRYVKNVSQHNAIKTLIQTGNKIIQKEVQTKQIQKEIEIYNIDDSDSEEDRNYLKKDTSIIASKSEVQLENSNNYFTSKNISNESIPVRQSLKSGNEISNIDKPYLKETTGQIAHVSTPTKLLGPKIAQEKKLKDEALQNTLKNLSKHITIKSGNSSPSLSHKSFDRESQGSKNDEGSDNDSHTNKVKITELEEDEFSDEDVDTDKRVNVLVQSPDYSNYNNENESIDEGDMDVESQININKLKKPYHTQKVVSETYTSDDENPINEEINMKNSLVLKSKGLLSNNKDLTISPMRRARSDNLSDVPSPSKSVLQSKTNNDSRGSFSQKSMPECQKNIVNKEVTVKTYESQTVIEEITTTVTKTIRTVNQTINQEGIINEANSPLKIPKVAQRNPNQLCRNIDKVPVRHSNPTGLPTFRPSGNIRNATPVKVSANTSFRPVNQIQSPNTVTNIIRQNRPRMPVKQNMTVSNNQQKTPIIGKPLKISPQVMTTVKRPINEKSDKFDSFKKPRESIANMPNDIKKISLPNKEGNTSFASSSHVTKCNYSSVTKTVKGNTTTTMSQIKSDVTRSIQQQMSKLNSMSGLKIVKTSQATNISKIEEKSDCGMKRATSEAIEMLQRQGLLVKKPKVDINEDSEHSNSECDDEGNDYLVEEFED